MTASQSPDKPQVFRSPTAVVVWIVWLLFAIGNWIDLAVQGRDHASAVAAAILLLATGAAYVIAQRPRIIVGQAGVTIRNPLRDHRIGWAGVAKVDLADLLRVHCELGGAAPGHPGGQDHKIISAWAVHYSRRRQLATEARTRRAARSTGLGRSPLGRPSGGRGLSYGAPVSAPEASAAEAEAEKVVRILSERATAARAEAVWANGTAEAEGSEAARRTGTAAGAGGAAGAGAEAPSGTGTATGTGTAAGTGTASPAGGTTALDAAGWQSGSEPLRSTWSGRAIAALVIPALILLVVWLL
jgi:PH (Pleckstrin Homology) domain-containing protein